MDISNSVTFITLVAGIMTLIAGIVSIIWFIRDVRKENSKMLKSQTEILVKIEEGQRKGFETLDKGLIKLGEISTNGFNTLGEISTNGFNTLAEILATVKAK